jgi:hypothetical protein
MGNDELSRGDQELFKAFGDPGPLPALFAFLFSLFKWMV